MNYTHIGEEIRKNASHFKNKDAIHYKDATSNSWSGITWTELGTSVENLSLALLNFGIKEQQNIGIFAENMPEWIIADLAILSIRSVTIPIYATNSKKEAEYIVNDAEIAVLFVGGQEEYNRALEISAKNKYLKLIVTLQKNISIKDGEKSIYLDDFVKIPAKENVNNRTSKKILRK